MKVKKMYWLSKYHCFFLVINTIFFYNSKISLSYRYLIIYFRKTESISGPV